MRQKKINLNKISNFTFRLEHAVLENPSNVNDSLNCSSILPSLTQYHVAAEQQDIGIGEDESDRISLNCEDGSLSSHSTGEHFTSDKLRNRSQSDLTSNNENSQTISNEEQQISTNHNENTNGILDFSFKIDNTNSTNRSRSLNTSYKSRSLKRKHPNGNNDHEGTSTMTTRIFHADAFCAICRKVFN